MEPSSAEESLSTVPWTCAGEIPIVKSVHKFFAGHFFDPEAAVFSSVPAMKQPPSCSDLEEVVPYDSELQEIARKTVLPVCEVKSGLRM